MNLHCPKCGATYAHDSKKWKCACGSYLNCQLSEGFTKDQIKKDRFNMWRYDEAYPIKYEDLSATYNEGFTPVAKIDWWGASLKVKLESLMPTGSFKDRGTVMSVNYLKMLGQDLITEDSSGNAAASVAAYGALAGMKSRIFVPAGNSSGKIIQTGAYGAEIIPVSGTRDQVALAAQEYEDSYAGHNWHPMFCQGIKSIAYEIWEQEGYNSPEAIIVPCGGASLALGLSYGFQELLSSGEIEKLPRIYAVQPENCNPIARAFNNDKSEFIPRGTVAEGTSIAYPVKTQQTIENIRATGGLVLSVAEDEIITALRKACLKGLYIEPTSAVAFAAVDKLIKEKELCKQTNTYVIATGNGLKAGETIKSLIL